MPPTPTDADALLALVRRAFGRDNDDDTVTLARWLGKRDPDSGLNEIGPARAVGDAQNFRRQPDDDTE